MKKLVVFGLGARGSIYATFATTYPEKFELTAIIENNAKSSFVRSVSYDDRFQPEYLSRSESARN